MSKINKICQACEHERDNNDCCGDCMIDMDSQGLSHMVNVKNHFSLKAQQGKLTEEQGEKIYRLFKAASDSREFVRILNCNGYIEPKKKSALEEADDYFNVVLKDIENKNLRIAFVNYKILNMRIINELESKLNERG